MSVKLMTQAWETDQKGNDLLVLLAMCDFASDEGILFPSLSTLGKKAKVAKTTLTYILNAYEEIGVITRTQRKRENKSDTSTMYKINHFKIDVEKYKEAYQKARNYTKKSQCEHPQEVHIVNTGNKIVNTQNANCEHLEPSSINHQRKNTKKEVLIIDRVTNPREIIEFYKNNISNKKTKLKEVTAINTLALHRNEMDLILIGLKNYAKALPDNENYITHLPNFIKNGMYYDYQEEVKKQSNNATGPTTATTIENINALFEEEKIIEAEVSA